MVNVVYAKEKEIALSQRKFAFLIFCFFVLSCFFVYTRITSLGAFSPWLANKDQEACVELPLKRLSRQEDKTSSIHLLLLLLM